jgi:hypothetical protein
MENFGGKRASTRTRTGIVVPAEIYQSVASENYFSEAVGM